ncbi:hypothetical protein J5N97_021070 [Dioscorea zingiberensis]|uniref:Uncharacterized protein n=1 Tax=Dioscorea zingiberensis TaxID=325984 RepID=A0A9D5HDW9_9LILI|nr:hypothetical protein J5N97_021070 [Dioscorea zingiberensis]
MYPALNLHEDSSYLNYIYGEEEKVEGGLDLNLSSITTTTLSSNPFPFLSNLHFSFFAPPPIEFKRGLKRSRNTRETDQTITTKKLRFHDLIGNFQQWFSTSEDNSVSDGNLAIVTTDIDDDGNNTGMHLVQLLISCAEAVACRDRVQASALLTELRANAMVLGTPFQRVASCFVQGLADRLTLVQPLGAVASMVASPNPAPTEKEEALSLVYELSPYIQFGHFIANNSILEAFEGETLVHILDLGMTMSLPHGHQWKKLLYTIATKKTPPPLRIRITGIGPCSNRLHTIGDELETYAKALGINLEFIFNDISLENLTIEHLRLEDNEVLAVNSIMQLHCVVKESRGALNSVLQMIHELSPRVFVLVEQDSSHNGPFFLGRFMEALHYYSAIFDSLDAVLPKYDTKRAKMEQFYFAEEIKNIVSCEGPARVERHERLDQWRRRMSRAGFQPAPLKLVAEAKQWLGKMSMCDGYTIADEKGSLVLGWKLKPLISASCWKS